MVFFRLVTLVTAMVVLASGGVVIARADSAPEPGIIAKARARIGPEAVLDAVKSIHYIGTLTGPDPANPSHTETQNIEIFLQKPFQQRIVISSDQSIQTSALDGYDAWKRTTDAKNPAKWQESLMSAQQIKELRADVWENFAFYRGIERIGGTVEDQGPATIDGIACEKIAFRHDPTLVYIRYFNQATGDLVYTGTEENNFRERGEIIAGGIHFPKTITISQLRNGRKEMRTISFEKITVNETFPRELFAVPLATVE